MNSIERAAKVKATRKINRRCCRNCVYYEDYMFIPDYYTGEDLPAWGCELINYDDETPLEDDELFIVEDDIGLQYLMDCDEFTTRREKDQIQIPKGLQSE